MSEVFVFGSNLAGRHGKGAALCAIKEHGKVVRGMHASEPIATCITAIKARQP